MPARSTYLVPAVLTMALALPAGAAEFCVVCAGPEKSYLCVTNTAGGATSPADQMRCMSEIAQQAGHASCSVSRTHAGPCSGPRIVLTAASAAPHREGPAAPAANETTIAKSLADLPPVAAGSRPDATPVAPAGASDDKTPLEKAGANIGNAAKKSWDCLTSLFKGC